jgi:hypothetical protein
VTSSVPKIALQMSTRAAGNHSQNHDRLRLCLPLT